MNDNNFSYGFLVDGPALAFALSWIGCAFAILYGNNELGAALFVLGLFQGGVMLPIGILIYYL